MIFQTYGDEKKKINFFGREFWDINYISDKITFYRFLLDSAISVGNYTKYEKKV